MNLDEFSFFNRQLAAMLDDGIPLEGALRQLCASMKRGKLRRELRLLEAELQKGVPLKEAVSARELPELYVRMVQAGHRSNNLAGVLTLVADHYHRTYAVWIRVQGLMVYPLLVLIAAFAVSLLLASMCSPLLGVSYGPFMDIVSFQTPARSPAEVLSLQIWILLPCVLLGMTLLVVCLLVLIPSLRRRAVWRLPALKEANLARFASSMELSIEGGCDLSEALATARSLEGESPLGKELLCWEKRLASGSRRLREIGADSRWIPPLFIWLVDSCGEDWVDGFRQARTIYGNRASARTEMLLHAALPVSILALAALVVTQLVPLMRVLTQLMNNL